MIIFFKKKFSPITAPSMVCITHFPLLCLCVFVSKKKKKKKDICTFVNSCFYLECRKHTNNIRSTLYICTNITTFADTTFQPEVLYKCTTFACSCTTLQAMIMYRSTNSESNHVHSSKIDMSYVDTARHVA